MDPNLAFGALFMVVIITGGMSGKALAPALLYGMFLQLAYPNYTLGAALGLVYFVGYMLANFRD